MNNNSNYCLLCDKVLDHIPHKLHNYHRYNQGYYIEYFKIKNEGFQLFPEENILAYIFCSRNAITLPYENISISLDQFSLFKGLHNWELAKPIVDKLKVFK